MPAIRCERCHKPKLIPRDEFKRWFMQTRATPFVPLREFLADYCTCEEEKSDG